MVYDTEDPTLIAKMNHEMREIESMEIVGVLSYTAAGQYPAGFGVTLTKYVLCMEIVFVNISHFSS